MAEHIEASYKESVADAEDGALVWIPHGDGSVKPAIKGTHEGESFVTILVDKLPRARGGEDHGPFIRVFRKSSG